MRKLRFSPATAISLVALFFSLTGAGLAASRYLITSTRQIAPRVLSGLQAPVTITSTSQIAPKLLAYLLTGEQEPNPVYPGDPANPPLTNDEEVGTVVTVAPGQTAESYAFCDYGEATTGGGYSAMPSASFTITSEGKDQSGVGWVVWLDDTSSVPVTFHALTECS